MDPKLTSATNYGDLKSAAEAYYDVERKIQDVVEKNNVSLLSMVTNSKSMSANIIDVLKQINQLTKDIEKAAEDRSELEKEFGTASAARKNDIKQSLESVIQRQAAYSSELESIQSLTTSGWMPMAMVIGTVYKLFVMLDESAFKFRIKMGATLESMVGIRNMAQDISIEFMGIGVTMDIVHDSVFAIGTEMGSMKLVTKDLATSVSILNAQLGVSQEDSAGFLRNMASMSNSTMKVQENLMYVAGYMTQIIGIPLPIVMKDIAKITSNTLVMISNFPIMILKAAVEARRLNTSINDIATGARSILNFSESINSEMSASVLIGKSIDLQYARELAFNGRLLEYNEEILRITKDIGFNKLNPLQQEEFAKAVGRGADELKRMLQARTEWNDAKNSNNPIIMKEVAAIEKMRAASNASLENEGKRLELSIRMLSNQTRMAAISQKWNAILAKISEPLLKITDIILGLVVPIMDIGRGIFGWTLAFSPILSVISYLESKFAKFAGLFGEIAWLLENILYGGRYIEAFVPRLMSYLGGLMEMLGVVGKFGLAFGKWIPVLGEIIMALQFIWEVGKGIYKLWENWGNMTLGEKICAGIAIPFKALKAILIQPFLDAWDYIGKWRGNSPSELGLSIVHGLLSVGAMIFDALTSPWRLAMAWIMDKIPGMSNVATKLRGGISGMLNTPVENKISASYIPAVQVTSNGNTILNPEQRKTTSESEDSRKSKYSMDDVYDMLKLLNDNLIGGKVKAGDVYLDSSLVSTIMSRGISFRGSFGNK